jgi:hypothetical protein
LRAIILCGATCITGDSHLFNPFAEQESEVITKIRTISDSLYPGSADKKNQILEPISKLSTSVTPAKTGVQKGPKMLDSATLHCMSGFRRNDNNVLLKLAALSFNQ